MNDDKGAPYAGECLTVCIISDPETGRGYWCENCPNLERAPLMSEHNLRGYIARGCRCPVCCQARKSWFDTWAPARLAALTPEQHGAAAYRTGCRCAKCKQAKRETRR